METLKNIASVAGYSGLYRILKPGRAGVIVESLDEKKAKSMMGATARVSVLNDISIYALDENDDEQSIPLSTVLMAIREKYGDSLPADPKSSTDEMADFMASVVPNYDRERVRTTDIKKLILWYGILRQFTPETFGPATEPEENNSVAETVADETAPVDDPAESNA